jgi:hypothetical protein
MGYTRGPDMSIEFWNFIPGSVLLREISQKYTVFRRLAKINVEWSDLLRMTFPFILSKSDTRNMITLFVFSLFSGQLSSISLF